MFSLLLAASLVTAIDAERAFARDAQRIGQWTAFRKHADETAVMFKPQAVWAHEWLANRQNPRKALRWGPSESWVSCDGRTAINRGPWTSPDGRQGFFTTVWGRKANGWRWAYDGVDTLTRPTAVPTRPRTYRANCGGQSRLPQEYRKEVTPTAVMAGKPPADAGLGRSADGTLIYEWKVAASGERRFEAKLWNGRDYSAVLDQKISVPRGVR